MNNRNISNPPPGKKIALINIFIYPVLLVAYLILHENNAYFGLIPVQFSLKLFFYYILFVGIASVCFKYVFKSETKAFLFLILLTAILLFFGSMQDFIKELPVTQFFKRYRFLLSFIIIIIIGSFILFRRSKKNFYQINKFIQITISILVVWELVHLSVNVLSGNTNKNILIEKSQNEPIVNAVTTANKPNIYFIVFDAFTSSRCLQEEFGYNNAEMDSFLCKNGFYIVTNSKSNYPITVYSIASTLNLSYLSDSLHNQEFTAKNMLQGVSTISKSRLIPYLQAKGYKIINHSVFNFENIPALGKTYFHKMPWKILTHQTLPGRFQKHVLWNFTHHDNTLSNPSSPISQYRTSVLQNFIYDKMKGLQSAVAENGPEPKFVYCHIMLPHEPYLFNKDGTLKNDSINSQPHSYKTEYLDQLIFTRHLVKEVIKTIFDKDTLNKIIVLEGDHGFRDFGEPNKINRFFDNLNAIYFYDKNYSALNDSMTPVNTFRIILNQYFEEKFRYLPDTSIFIHDPGFDVGQFRKN